MVQFDPTLSVLGLLSDPIPDSKLFPPKPTLVGSRALTQCPGGMVKFGMTCQCGGPGATDCFWEECRFLDTSIVVAQGCINSLQDPLWMHNLATRSWVVQG